MILTSCPNSAINRLFSKQNILITDYGPEIHPSKNSKKGVYFSRKQKTKRPYRQIT